MPNPGTTAREKRAKSHSNKRKAQRRRANPFPQQKPSPLGISWSDNRSAKERVLDWVGSVRYK